MTTPTAPGPRFWNVPNSLTMARLALTFVLFGAIAAGRFGLALGLFALAALTDALDGYFARLLNQSTPIGRQLDPLVDKVLVAGAYIFLLPITVGPGTGLAPWIVTTVVVRELVIQWLRSLLEGRGEAFGAKTAGKLKTLVQCLSIVAILLTLALWPISSPWGQSLLWFRDALTWTGVALSLFSGLGYILAASTMLRAPSAVVETPAGP